MNAMQVVIVDDHGIEYQGDTIEKKGLGGSEAAIILLSRELVKLGLKVTVFNHCKNPGLFNSVEYKNIKEIDTWENECDIFISQRSFFPFYSEELAKKHFFKTGKKIKNYSKILKKSKWKVAWLHDYFTEGQENLQFLLENSLLNEVFTLSDAHFLYTIRPLYFENIKDKFFHTRNGIINFENKIDISQKNKNHFIFNASAIKGLEPLLQEVWPKINKKIPSAKLTIIGGFYEFPEEKLMGQVKDWKEKFLKFKKIFEGQMNIHFAGLVTVEEVAKIYKDASYFIYPCTFPETFGISLLEAINYNVVLISVKYGAIEEIPESVSYTIDGPYLEKNNSAEKLLELAEKVFINEEIKTKKMQSCDSIKKYLGWDVVALQWKIHFESKLKLEHSSEEKNKNKENFYNIMKFFNKQFINKEDLF